MPRELVGEIGVDSGSVMIIDPGYLNDPMRWKPEKFLESVSKFEAEHNYHMASNMKRLYTEKSQLQKLVGNWDGFCKDADESNFEPREYAGGIITPTRHGDGGYPVYVTRDKEGRVKKMEIVF